jgi:hypothetical protein
MVSAPLAGWLRTNFGPENVSKSGGVGNIGVLALRLSQAPGREVVVTPGFKSGDRSRELALR